MKNLFVRPIAFYSVAVLLAATHVIVAGSAVAEGVWQETAAKMSALASAAAKPVAPLQQASVPSPAPGQQGSPEDSAAVARSFAELTATVEPGDTVYVTRQAGERTKATVQGFDADLETLFFNTGGTSFGLTENELRQLELRHGDSLVNGAVIGAVAGSGIFVIAGIACALVDSCSAAGETFAAAALFGGIGAGIGVGIDAAVKTERLVYVAPAASARRLALRPVLSRTRRGAVVVLRF